MSNEIVPFEAKLKEKVKDLIGELIPDEAWEAIVEQEVREFKRNTLPDMVRNILREHYAQFIRAELRKPEWAGRYSGSGHELASGAIEEMIKAAAPAVLASLVGGAIQTAVDNLQNSLAYKSTY